MKWLVKKIRHIPAMFWSIVGLIVLLSSFIEGFSNPTNIEIILKNTSILIIVALGMTLTMISGQLDLSIGSVMSLSGMMAALYLRTSEVTTVGNVVVAVLLGMLVGLAFGFFNGIMIGKYKFDFWLITFASMSIAAGLTQVVSSGNIVAGFSKKFRFLGNGSILGISTIIYIALLISVLIIFMARRTRFGLHIFAVGDSEQCARQSGINVDWTRVKIYLVSGLLSGIGGVLLASKTNSISPIAGEGYEFDAIAAAVVGGTSFDGGKGSVGGTIIGALLIAIIKNALKIVGLSSYWQQTLIGLFILSVIVIDVFNSTRRETKNLRRVYKDAK